MENAFKFKRTSSSINTKFESRILFLSWVVFAIFRVLWVYPHISNIRRPQASYVIFCKLHFQHNRKLPQTVQPTSVFTWPMFKNLETFRLFCWRFSFHSMFRDRYFKGKLECKASKSTVLVQINNTDTRTRCGGIVLESLLLTLRKHLTVRILWGFTHVIHVT